MGGLISLVLIILAGVGLALALKMFITPFPWYGWVLALLAPFGLLTLGFALATAVQSRKQPAYSTSDTEGDDVSAPEEGESVEPVPDPDRPGRYLCPQCGSSLFEAVPGETSREEIIRFVRSTDIFGDNPDAADGWIHPGVYCPNGCLWIRAEYPPGPDKAKIGAAPSMEKLKAMEMAALKQSIEGHERGHGYYIIGLVPIRRLREDGKTQAEILDFIVDHFDDDPNEYPPENVPPDATWEDLEVSEAEARAEAVAALRGGNDIGHLGDTIPLHLAEQYFEDFRNLFSPGRRYYTGLGIGDPEYVFMQGVLTVDENQAGILWVVESD